MSLWHRAPREVYRVYGEDEYLAGEAAPVADTALADGSLPHAALADEPQPHAALTGARANPGRLLGLVLLIGVTAGTLGLIVLHVSHLSKATHSGVVAGEAIHEARPDATRQGSPVEGMSVAERASAASLPEARHRSKILAPKRVSSAHESILSHLQGEPSGSVKVRSPLCCVWASSPTLRMSRSNLPAEAVASSSLDDEFGFER